ncbi:pentatricopeptide repeat-containing protein At1g73400, mitochondrial [Impatiens glandulifera]|uniref:pentatricopeptide repeat-containing protein At1g73400, mitochondrial n=1 Tax=Impatiens glandulifera TaxID=253017 RepID=UPI001FB11E6C|nr:pentatricopeptide repeat-containing protein At1g73400, mitochondrial [Impatiens glandulifera]
MYFQCITAVRRNASSNIHYLTLFKPAISPTIAGIRRFYRISASYRSSYTVPLRGSSIIFNLPAISTFLSYSNEAGNESSSSETDPIVHESSTTNCDKLYTVITENPAPYSNMEKCLDLTDIDLTTDLVLQVLHKLHYEEKLAFRFFTWAGHKDCYDHEPQAFNTIIDILSSTQYKTKQFGVLCDLLDYMKRNDRKSVPIQSLLTILKQYTERHLTHLDKFAKKKKIKPKTQPEVHSLNILLDSFCKCGLVSDAETMFKKIKNKIEPNETTYNILFFGWCRVRNPTRGMSLLREMIETGHKPENFTYNTAIDSYCKSGMLAEATELLDFMRKNGSTMSSPTAKTYVTMISVLIENDRMEESFKLIGEMISSGCLPDVSTYKEMIESMCLSGKFDAAYRFIVVMGDKGYPPDIVTYNCFLKVLCENKQGEEAMRLYKRMIEVGCIPSVHTYNMLISMFFKIDDVDGAFEAWFEMEKQGCDRDVNTYCVMMDGLFACGNVDDARVVLEEVMDKGMKLPYPRFDSLLMHLSRIGDIRGIQRLSELMRKFYNPSMARRFALSQKRKSISLRGK